MKRLMLLVTAQFFMAAAVQAAEISIDSPRGGFTTARVQEISGTVTGFSGTRADLIINGIPQSIPLTNGSFKLNTVVAPGTNLVEVRAGDAVKRVSFFASVPSRDVKVVLTWDTPTDVDLWVIDPKGEKCYYANRSTKLGGNLDVDITTGFGPETFTMASAYPGTYAVQVQYYSSSEAPVTRVNVHVVLYEGTPRERRQQFQFVMTRQHQVFHIGEFTIDPQ